jgi:hypothetical protein
VIKDCVLDNPTDQDIFDYVFEGLYKRGKRAYDNTHLACQYKTIDGSKCAVGMLITDEYYAKYGEVIEGSNIADLRLSYVDEDRPLIPTLAQHSDLLGDLQEIHDQDLSPMRIGEGTLNFRHKLVEAFTRIAKHYDLNTDRIKHHEAQ